MVSARASCGLALEDAEPCCVVVVDADAEVVVAEPCRNASGRIEAVGLTGTERAVVAAAANENRLRGAGDAGAAALDAAGGSGLTTRMMRRPSIFENERSGGGASGCVGHSARRARGGAEELGGAAIDVNGIESSELPLIVGLISTSVVVVVDFVQDVGAVLSEAESC